MILDFLDNEYGDLPNSGAHLEMFTTNFLEHAHLYGHYGDQRKVDGS